MGFRGGRLTAESQSRRENFFLGFVFYRQILFLISNDE
jgi:hypothetical protein